MRYLGCLLGFIVLLGAAIASAAESPTDKPTPDQIRAWRAEGPAAVDRLMLERQQRIAAAEKLQREGSKASSDLSVFEQTPELRAAWERVYEINATIDAVAAARYSHESGLYWYTDEAEAKRVAKEQGKPLLALRLLGNLDEELSCANSRYFRILLYPDDKVRKLLHDKFVLTWKSVRPVPKITIDLGDGRKVERTITGNSVHYVLAPGGQIVDVFPGLYGPVPFCERLEKAHEAVVTAIRAREPGASITEYRKQRIAELKRGWEADVAKYSELQRQPRKHDDQSKYVGWAPAPQPSCRGVSPRILGPQQSEYGPDQARSDGWLLRTDLRGIKDHCDPAWRTYHSRLCLFQGRR